MDQDPCRDPAVASCEVKPRREAVPPRQAPLHMDCQPWNTLPGEGKAPAAVRALSFWSLFMDLENFNSPKVIF